MSEKAVYSNKVNDIVIDGQSIRAKRVQLPAEQGYQHEDDLQGGGVVKVVSSERRIRIDVGVSANNATPFDWSTVKDSEIVVHMQTGAQYTYKNCYIATDGEPDFAGSGAAVRTVEILVGERVTQ